MPRAVRLFAWRDAVMSESGPKLPTDRLHLMVVSLYMSEDGSHAFPSQKTIAKRAGTGLRTVKRSLERCEKLGWISRMVERRPGSNWPKTYYFAVVPDTEQTTPDHGATVAPCHGAMVAPCPSAPDPTMVPEPSIMVPPTATHGATGADHGANGDQTMVPSFGLLTPNLNSSGNSSHTSSEARVKERVTEKEEPGRKQIAGPGRFTKSTAAESGGLPGMSKRSNPGDDPDLARRIRAYVKTVNPEGIGDVARVFRTTIPIVEAALREVPA